MFNQKQIYQKKKFALIYEQRTQLPFTLFQGDYIPIVYVNAHSYVTICDLYRCQRTSQVLGGGDEARIWQVSGT